MLQRTLTSATEPTKMSQLKKASAGQGLIRLLANRLSIPKDVVATKTWQRFVTVNRCFFSLTMWSSIAFRTIATPVST